MKSSGAALILTILFVAFPASAQSPPGDDPNGARTSCEKPDCCFRTGDISGCAVAHLPDNGIFSPADKQLFEANKPFILQRPDGTKIFIDPKPVM